MTDHPLLIGKAAVYTITFERVSDVTFYVKAKSYDEALAAANALTLTSELDRDWDIGGCWNATVQKTPSNASPDYVIVRGKIMNIADDPSTDPHNPPCPE